MLEKFLVGSISAGIICVIPVLWKLSKQKKVEAIQEGRVYYGLFYCRIIYLLLAGLLVAEFAMLLFFGNISVTTPLFIFFIVLTILLTIVFLRSYQKWFSKKHLRRPIERRDQDALFYIVDYSDADSIYEPSSKGGGWNDYSALQEKAKKAEILNILSLEREEPKLHGSYNVRSSDIALQTNDDMMNGHATGTVRKTNPEEHRVLYSTKLNHSKDGDYYYEPETKSFKLKTENVEKNKRNKFKWTYVLVLLIIVETVYIIFTNIGTGFSSKGNIENTTIRTAIQSTAQNTTGDYWTDAFKQLEEETAKKKASNQTTTFVNGKTLVEPHSECVCPLIITARSSDSCYVYMRSATKWNDDISFMIEANNTVELEVPEGEYGVYWASGKKWLGQVQKFGEDTNYFKLDGTLKFTSDDEYYYGHELELRTNTKDRINEDNFPG